MSIALVVTGGFGNGTLTGSIADVTRRGYGADAEIVVGDPAPPPTGGSGVIRHTELDAFRDRFKTNLHRDVI